MRYRKGQVYVRKMRKTDKTDNWQTAIKMAYYQNHATCYVVVRHGGGILSNTVIVAQKTKRLCKESFLGGWNNAKKFWSLKKKDAQ